MNRSTLYIITITSLVSLVAAHGIAQAVTEARAASGADCTIDNGDAVEANIDLINHEVVNEDSADAYLVCGVPVGPGWEADDLYGVTVYVYDGNDADGVSGQLYWHGTTSGNWDLCSTVSTNNGSVGDNSLNWVDLDDASTCTDHTTGWASVRVKLPEIDGATTSKLLGTYVQHVVP